MKKLLLFSSVLLAIQFISSTTYSQIGGDQYSNQDAGYQTDISFQTFYDELSPYGQWIDDPNYGNVWQPSVGDNFKPYATNGHWVYSDIGWTWVSGYSWGWATFHYGRWFFDREYGWLWIPGYDWAPAWVSWRSSHDYYGWAPLTPNVSLDISIGSYNPPYNYWCFVPNQYICSPNVNNYYLNESRNITIINNTTIINNVNTFNQGYNINGTSNFRNRAYYAAGPNPREVEHFTGNTVRPVVIRDNGRPGNAQINEKELFLYRPRVVANFPQRSDVQQRMAPSLMDQSRNSRTAMQDYHGIPIARPDKRSLMPDRRSQIIDNSQPLLNNGRPNSPAADPRMNSYSNNNFDAARRQNAGNTQPAINVPRPAIQSPGFNPGSGNIFNRNEYRPAQAPQPRTMNQQPQNEYRPAQAPQPRTMNQQPQNEYRQVQAPQPRTMNQQPTMVVRSTPQSSSGRPFVNR